MSSSLVEKTYERSPVKDTTRLDQLYARRAEAQDCFDAILNHILHIKKSADAADCKMLLLYKKAIADAKEAADAEHDWLFRD